MEGHKAGTRTFTKKLRNAILHGAILAATGLLIGAVYNSIRPDGLSWKGEWPSSDVSARNSRGLITISMDEAWSLYMDEKALFLDARDPESYQNGHLPGAMNVPVKEGEKYIEEKEKLVRYEKVLITYCDDPDCPLSAQLAEILRRYHAGDVRIMTEGWAGWVEAGFPVEEGDNQ